MYLILGVPETATHEQIKQAYFELAKKHHPDIDQSKGSAVRFQVIQNAYEILSNKAKREIYDTTGNYADFSLHDQPADEGKITRVPGGVLGYQRFKHPQTYHELKQNAGGLGEVQFDIKIDIKISFIESIAGFTRIVKFYREEQ